MSTKWHFKRGVVAVSPAIWVNGQFEARVIEGTQDWRRTGSFRCALVKFMSKIKIDDLYSDNVWGDGGDDWCFRQLDVEFDRLSQFDTDRYNLKIKIKRKNKPLFPFHQSSIKNWLPLKQKIGENKMPQNQRHTICWHTHQFWIRQVNWNFIWCRLTRGAKDNWNNLKTFIDLIQAHVYVYTCIQIQMMIKASRRGLSAIIISKKSLWWCWQAANQTNQPGSVKRPVYVFISK